MQHSGLHIIYEYVLYIFGRHVFLLLMHIWMYASGKSQIQGTATVWMSKPDYTLSGNLEVTHRDLRNFVYLEGIKPHFCHYRKLNAVKARFLPAGKSSPLTSIVISGFFFISFNTFYINLIAFYIFHQRLLTCLLKIQFSGHEKEGVFLHDMDI